MCALMCDAGSKAALSHGNIVFSAIQDVYIYSVSSKGSFFLSAVLSVFSDTPAGQAIVCRPR